MENNIQQSATPENAIKAKRTNGLSVIADAMFGYFLLGLVNIFLGLVTTFVMSFVSHAFTIPSISTLRTLSYLSLVFMIVLPALGVVMGIVKGAKNNNRKINVAIKFVLLLIPVLWLTGFYFFSSGILVPGISIISGALTVFYLNKKNKKI